MKNLDVAYDRRDLFTGKALPNQLHKLLNFSREAICLLNADGVFTETNTAACSLLGYQPQEIIGRSLLDFVVLENYLQTREAIRKLKEEKGEVNFVHHCIQKGGDWVCISWSAQWDENENMIYCIAHPVAENKEGMFAFQNNKNAKQKSDNHVYDVIERIGDAFFSMNKNWEITYISSPTEKMLNINKHDYLGNSFWDCFPGMIGSAYHIQYHNAMRDQVAVHFEEYFEPFDKWLSVDAYPSQSGLSIFFRDISEVKRLEAERAVYEEELKRQNEQLINVLEGMNQGFFALDHDFKVRYWNKRTEQASGMPREKILGEPLLDWYCTEAREMYFEMFSKALHEQQSFHSEHLCPQANKWVELDVYPTKEGISVFFKDIDDRKRAEEELRRLSLVAEHTVNSVSICDIEQKVVWVNKAAERLSGYTSEEIIGRPISEVVDGPEPDAEIQAYVKQCWNNCEPFQFEVINYKKSGEPYWVHVSSQPLFDENGKLKYYFSLATDITERKTLEQELRAQQNKTSAVVIAAQEKVRAQVGIELHDNVNQVLTSVKLYQELCLSGIGDQEELMRRSATLLQESINEIRSLSKRLSAPTLGSIRLTESITELMETVAATKKFEMILDTEAVDYLDVEQEMHLAIYRILQEHMTNVLKYADASTVEVQFDIIDDHLILKVIDDGKGFDTAEKSGGIGITNMKMRAESINGWLTIDSDPGTGCSLSASFPLFS